MRLFYTSPIFFKKPTASERPLKVETPSSPSHREPSARPSPHPRHRARAVVRLRGVCVQLHGGRGPAGPAAGRRVDFSGCFSPNYIPPLRWMDWITPLLPRVQQHFTKLLLFCTLFETLASLPFPRQNEPGASFLASRSPVEPPDVVLHPDGLGRHYGVRRRHGRKASFPASRFGLDMFRLSSPVCVI